MAQGISGVLGDGVSQALVKDPSNSAVATILVDCDGGAEQQVFTSQTWEVGSIAVEVNGQSLPATPPPTRTEFGGGRFSVRVAIGGLVGGIPARALLKGTKTTENTKNNTTVTNPWSEDRQFTIQVVLDATAPSLSVASFGPQTAPEAKQSFVVNVSDQTGVRSCTWEVPGFPALACTPTAPGAFTVPFDWRQATSTDRAQACPPAVTVRVRARDLAVPGGNQGVLDVTLRDQVAPTVVIEAPLADENFPNDGTGATVRLAGRAQDHWSGVAAVEYSLDGRDWTRVSLPAVGSATSIDWAAPVRIDDYGGHELRVRAADVAGNWVTTPASVQFEVAAPVSTSTTTDPLSPTAYLADLLDFAGRSVTLPRNTAAQLTEAAERRLVSVEICRAFSQRPADVIRGGDRVGGGRVGAVRGAVEVLHRVLDPLQKDLVAHWEFNEGAGPSVADSSGNDFSARVVAGAKPQWTQGRGTSSALRFDGVGDELAVTTPGALTMWDSVSVVAWLKPEGQTTADYAVILAKEGEYAVGRSPEGFVGVALANANPGWTWLRTSVTLPEGQWSHLAVVYGAEVLLVYLNGRLAYRRVGQGPIASAAPLVQDVRIGGRQAGPARFKGVIDELRLYRGAVPAATVRLLYDGVNVGLLARWPLSERREEFVADEVAGRRLVLDGATWEEGRRGWALSVAPGRRAHVDDVQALQLGADGADFTVTAWICLRGEPGTVRRSILRKAATADQHTPELFVPAGTSSLQVVVSTEAGAEEGPGPVALPPGQWTHVACVKEVDQLVLYVDGRVAGRQQLTAKVVANDGPITIGDSIAGEGFAGLLAGLEFHERPLTGAEIAQQAAATAEATKQYLVAAYLTSLSLNGVSYDELRLVRATQDRTARERLAARLGFRLRPGRPDELDELFVPLDQLSERWLAEVFGLQDTSAPETAAVPVAKLARWRQAALRLIWQEQDNAASRAAMPLLDPAVLGPDDVVESSGLRPILTSRAAALGQRRDQLRALREQAADAAAGFVSMVAEGLGVPVARLAELEAVRAKGESIAGDLTQLHLTLPEFSRLLVVRDLAAAALVYADDWSDVEAILLAVYRRGLLVQWRNAERTALSGSPLFMAPEYFSLRSGVADAIADRAVQSLRVDLEDRLAGRVEQAKSVETSATETAFQAEELTLVILRDALILAAARVLGIDASIDALSARLLIDVGASGTAPRTVRAMLGVELVGGLLFALRSRRLAAEHPAAAWRVPESDAFDVDWQWMSSYEAWRAAMLAFFYPETMLYPALRPTGSGGRSQSAAFGALLSGLRRRDATPAQRVTQALKDFTTQRGKGAAPIPDDYVPSESDPQTHRALNDTIAPGRPGSVVVEEVLYFVPLAVAVQYHRWGLYAKALDWFRLVYDDTAPVGQRLVYAGLRAEKNDPPTLSRTQEWLRDLNPHVLAGFHGGNPYTRFTVTAVARCLLDLADSEFTRATGDALARARAIYLTASDVLFVDEVRQPTPAPAGLLPENPVLSFLRLRAANQLRKLRQGRNIAGMLRPSDDQAETQAGPVLDSSGLPVLPTRGRLHPTGYRYSALMERVRRLVTLAAQVEGTYLAALERQDTETYRAVEAGQHLAVAQQGVQLQKLRVAEADDSKQLALRRQQRVRIQQSTYSDWLEAGPNAWEEATLAAYITAGAARTLASGFQAAASVANVAATATGATPAAAPAATTAVGTFATLTALGHAAAAVASAAETTAQVSSLTASWERREQQWELEKNLADQDYLIGDQETKLADDHHQIAAQELSVATLQTEHAKAVADYLATKFLNQELYGWMSGVLGDVYASLLQQATAVAALAQQQLAFERQIQPPSFIKEDYWAATPEAGTAATSDRRGLTGSARLLQDVEKLDQYAFENDRRKLDLTQTFSLAALAPFEFERFRSTGVLPFSTPMRLFDQSFPGHYLRLIRRIRISLVALIPPVTGIRATLTASGLSRVVVKNESFQQVTVRRDPEQVALTSPTSASGVFELDVQPEMLLPFEAMGVDTSWEFQLPKPANPIDFANVADVYVAFEYTALADPDYRTQVIAELGRKVSAERSYSLRSDFPDLWYELNNTAEERPRAAFTTRRQDFPPHLDNLKLVHIVFYLVSSGDDVGEIDLDHLHFRPRDSAASDPPLGGPARTTTAGLISTRRANGASWLTLQNSSPLGLWEFEFGPQLKPLLLDGTVADVLLVLSYTGETPPWPQW